MEGETHFHEQFEPLLRDVKVYWLDPGMKKPLTGEFYRVKGIPSYLIRKRLLGVYLNTNFELIKFVSPEEARVVINFQGVEFYGRMMPIATTSEHAIIKEARDSWLCDLLKDVNLSGLE